MKVASLDGRTPLKISGNRHASDQSSKMSTRRELNIGPYVKIHVGWVVGMLVTILARDHLKAIPPKFGFNWLSKNVLNGCGIHLIGLAEMPD